MGRPSLYKTEYCESLLKHMAEGYSFESFGADVNVGARTLYDWVDAHDDFAKAKAQGQLKSLKWWENLLRAVVAGKIRGGSAAVLIFTFKCRFKEFGWRDNEPEQVKKPENSMEEAVKLLSSLKLMVEDKCQKISSSSSSQPPSESGLLTECSETK